MTRFYKRERVVTPQRLALTMIDGFDTRPLAGIADIHRTFNKTCQQTVHYIPFGDQLAKRFPGRFPTVSPAAVELHVNLDLLTEIVHSVWLSPDSEAERHFYLRRTISPTTCC